MARPLVLVPGACLGGWAWRDVAASLRQHGHDVYPMTLTGLGERVHLANPSIDIDTHIEDVLSVLDYEDLHDAVLVGHSYAGIVVTGAADRRPERLNAVVYFDAPPIPDGMALTDVQPPEMRDAQRREAEERGEGWRWPVPDRAMLESGKYGSPAGLADADYAAFASRGTPQPYKTFTTPLRLRHAAPPGVRRVAVFCAAGGIDVATVRALIEQQDPRAMPFSGGDWELHELPTGHWAMFTEPARSAELLARIAAG